MASPEVAVATFIVKSLNDALAQVNVMSCDLGCLSARLDMTNVEVESLKGIVKSCTSDLAKAQTTLSEFEALRARLPTEEKLAAAREEIAALRAENALLKESIKSMVPSEAKVVDDIAMLRYEIATLRHEMMMIKYFRNTPIQSNSHHPWMCLPGHGGR